MDEHFNSWIVGFIDGEGQLSCYQHFRLENLGRALAWLNRSINRNVLESSEDPEQFKSETSLLDARSRELWRQRAERGEPWISLQGDEIEVDLPLTPPSWDLIQRRFIDGLSDGPDREGSMALGQILSHLRHWEIGRESVVIALGAPVTGIYRLDLASEGPEYDPGLLEALEERGWVFEETSLEELRELIGLSP